MYINHNFFIHPPTGKLKGCSPVLAIVNNATMNTGVKVSFELMFLFPLDVFPEVGPYGSSMFNFLRSLHTVFHRPVPIYNPTNTAQGFPFLHIHASKCHLLYFDSGHSNKHEVRCHCF